MHAASRAVHGRPRVQQPRWIFLSPLRGVTDHEGSREAARDGVAGRALTGLKRKTRRAPVVFRSIPLAWDTLARQPCRFPLARSSAPTRSSVRSARAVWVECTVPAIRAWAVTW